MIIRIPAIDETPACGCGAALEEGQGLCRKCRARDRWMRRRTAGRRNGRRSAETRRPGTRSNGLAQAGVTWT
ncbi:hypothetical protein [Streptosporangium sp. KLBMP 9127]|nr:hypothetical protein [Streptosporangium sp. KLBMP 9127]